MRTMISIGLMACPLSAQLPAGRWPDGMYVIGLPTSPDLSYIGLFALRYRLAGLQRIGLTARIFRG